jgi:GNAT superfamily N-acetyltransferase
MSSLQPRVYQGEDDYQRIRDFLCRVSLANDRHVYSWPVMRLDYWRWHGILNLGDGNLEKDVTLWVTEDDQIAAVLNPDERRQVYLQVHPLYKSYDLEAEMVVYAEEHLRTPSRRGGQVIWIWTYQGDDQRQALLLSRGYSPIYDAEEHHWRRSLELPISDRSISEGYFLRSLGDVSELPSRARASWRAFHPNEPEDKYHPDRLWYRNIQSAPLYRPELDLVVISPACEVAAFATIWYEAETRTGYFEPVGTVPEHQRRGLASALCYEGLRRLKQAGATLAIVAGGSPHANALYRSVFGPEYDLALPWEKRWE